MKIFKYFYLLLLLVPALHGMEEKQAKIKELQAIIDKEKEKLKEFANKELLTKASSNHDLQSCDALCRHVWDLSSKVSKESKSNVAELQKNKEMFKAATTIVRHARLIWALENS